VDPQTICHLVDVRLKYWQGLGALDRAQLPSCIGTEIDRTTIRFRMSLLAVSIYRPATVRGEVRVFWAINGETIELVEVRPCPSLDAAGVLAELDPLAESHRYSIDDCTAAHLTPPQGGTIDEMIYPDRGLAIALARHGSGAASVVRIRGFEPMPAKQYLADYVSLVPQPC
jgi:hypothetical protein